MARSRGDSGSVTVELVVLAPAFALFLAMVVLVGRIQSSRADIEAAAHSAVRTITLSRDLDSAVETARTSTQERLRVGSSSCRSLDWDAQLTATDATVTISCEVDLADLAALPVPGTTSVTAESTEPIDRMIEGRT